MNRLTRCLIGCAVAALGLGAGVAGAAPVQIKNSLGEPVTLWLWTQRSQRWLAPPQYLVRDGVIILNSDRYYVVLRDQANRDEILGWIDLDEISGRRPDAVIALDQIVYATPVNVTVSETDASGAVVNRQVSQMQLTQRPGFNVEVAGQRLSLASFYQSFPQAMGISPQPTAPVTTYQPGPPVMTYYPPNPYQPPSSMGAPPVIYPQNAYIRPPQRVPQGYPRPRGPAPYDDSIRAYGPTPTIRPVP